MTTALIVAGVFALIGGLIWMLVHISRRQGASDANLDQERRARDAAEDMLNADQPRDRDDTADRLRDGRF